MKKLTFLLAVLASATMLSFASVPHQSTPLRNVTVDEENNVYYEAWNRESSEFEKTQLLDFGTTPVYISVKR